MDLEKLKAEIKKEMLEEDIATAKAAMKRKFRELALLEDAVSKKMAEIAIFEEYINDEKFHLVV